LLKAYRLLQLLLGAELGSTSTALLAAVDGTGVHAGIALAANHLILVILAGKNLERRLNDSTTETEDQMESRLLLDVVVSKSAAIFELLSGENETLLIRGDTFLILNLGLDVFCNLGIR
jgi:hypothetical protein